jgi:paraquat-inducible protein B
MQINGAQLAAVIYPKTSEFQRQARSPVIIDVKLTVDSVEKASHEVSSDLSLYRQAITTHETQQTRFVRLSATTEQPASNSRSSDQSAPLPRSVQQYLQVADSTSELPQRLFDEIV